MNLSEIKTKVERLRGQRSQLQRQLKETKTLWVRSKRDAMASEEARAFLQVCSKETQDKLQYHITELGSMALEAVFGEGIKLGLEFEEKRGKTEAGLSFLRRSEDIWNNTSPLEADSGGAADIAAFALRCSLWSLMRPRTESIIVLDEPFKNINDPSREMHRRAAEMVKEVSEKLDMQFIIVTAVPELEEIADNVIRVERKWEATKRKRSK